MRVLSTFGSLVAAGVLAASQALAGNGGLTVTVYGDSPASGGPGSVLGELGGPPLEGATVTITNLETGKTTQLGTTDAHGSVGKQGMNESTYKVEVTVDGKTGVSYVQAGGFGAAAETSFATGGLPSTGSSGPKAVGDLKTKAVAALEAGDDEAYQSATAELSALEQQDESALEQLQKIADAKMGELPTAVREELRREIGKATDPAGAAVAVGETKKDIQRDADRAVRMGAATIDINDLTPVFETLDDLLPILEKLKMHESRLGHTKSAVKKVAAAVTDRRQSSAGRHPGFDAMQTVQRQVTMPGQVSHQPHSPAHVPKGVQQQPQHPPSPIRLSIPSH